MFRALMPIVAAAALAAAPSANSQGMLHSQRSAPGDLEVGGDLANVPPGATRYVRYEDLLRLPQETYTVSDDSNFQKKTQIGGVALTELAQKLGESPQSTLIVAICYDKYRTNYPVDYVAVHHPLLVLRINGKLREQWPHSAEGGSLSPYVISHPFFKPAFKVLSHEDEPQIPYGVTRIEFRRQSVVFGAIEPRGEWPVNSPVKQGYIIARQDCFRCHNMGAQGGTLAGRSWLKLAARAAADDTRFKQTIHDPASVTPGAKMPAHGDYDDATLNALAAYFKTFSGVHADSERRPKP